MKMKSPSTLRKFRQGLRLICAALASVTVSACGGGHGSHPLVTPTVMLPSPPVMEFVSSMGTITALASVTVNGVRYQTDTATVTVNGQPASLSDLELGQFATVEGTIEADGPRGSADRIDYDATVIGPVESLDAALGQLIVMGQTVRTDSDTVFDSSIDPDTFAGLTSGSLAEVSGYFNAAGEIIATRVAPGLASSAVQLIGQVAGLDSASLLFTIGRLTVDYSNATRIDLPGGSPVNSMFVMVRGILANGIMRIEEIENLYELDAPGERAQVQGSITRFSSTTDFDVNGYPVTLGTATVFINGKIDDLLTNAQITIDGDVTTGGDGILANEITFGRLINPTSTVAYEFANFTDVSVLSVFNATITQGSDFQVEVTVDNDIVDRLVVTQSGTRLILDLTPGDNNAETLDAVVTMPVLNQINVDGVARAVVRDFNQMQMTASVGGVGQLRGDGLMISDLSARISGVSQLNFGNISPLANTDIDVSGVSSATLNMDIGSTLTGSVTTGQGTGTSGLFYFGTDVTVDVTTDSQSSVTRLGDTRL